MRPILTILTTLIFSLILTSQTGCLIAAAAAGTGATVAYVRGDTETAIDGNAKQVTTATERAMKDLDIAVISTESSSIDGKVIGRTGRDVKLTVVVTGESEKISRVSIRAGVFGNDAIQTNLLEKIKAETAAGAATASTESN